MKLTTNDAVAARIKKLLKERGITLYRLEQKSGVYHGVMDRIMKGINHTIELSTTFKLARGFNMGICEFFNDDVFRSEDLEID